MNKNKLILFVIKINLPCMQTTSFKLFAKMASSNKLIMHVRQIKVMVKSYFLKRK